MAAASATPAGNAAAATAAAGAEFAIAAVARRAGSTCRAATRSALRSLWAEKWKSITSAPGGGKAAWNRREETAKR